MVALLMMGVACNQGPAKAPVIGEAFAGPVTLNIRQEISLKSPTVATVKHGDRLAILQIRRRFTRVRAENGAEGWCDGEKLLTPEQMDRLQATNEVAAKLPSQGQAMVYDVLNIHTEPNRQAPSFHQLKENDKVEILGHRLAPRVPFQAAVTQQFTQPTATPAPKKRASRKEKEKAKPEALDLPPMPRPPGPPPNWLELSRRVELPDNETKPTPAPAAPAKDPAKPEPEAVRMEDWSLVRSVEGRAGWVLTRALTMTIPDEVAQYAEGHRITSWFPLGEVTTEEGAVKKHYLWTTIPRGGREFEFDGLRVFIFNARRKRYETAFRLREVKGFFPSAVHPVEVTSGKKTSTVTGFSVVLENPEGTLERRTYAFEGYRVRLLTTSPWERLADPFDVKAMRITKPFDPSAGKEKTFWERMKEKVPFLSQS
jgi:SH3-like domain-containing protein